MILPGINKQVCEAFGEDPCEVDFIYLLSKCNMISTNYRVRQWQICHDCVCVETCELGGVYVCMCACMYILYISTCTVYFHLYCIFPLVLYISVVDGCNMFRVSPAGVLGNLFFGLSLGDSIEHRRVHHQLEPDTVFAEGMCFTCIASAPGC